MLIRRATPEDFQLYVDLVPELGVDDPPAVFESWVKTQLPETLVAEHGGREVGVCWYQQLADSGYVKQVMVARDARRLGAGRALLLEVARLFREAGVKRWALNVKPENTPALTLYRSLGFARAYASSSLKLSWDEVLPRLPAPRAPAHVVTPAEDAVVETTFHLPRGQLANHRGVGRVLLAVGAAPDGYAAFSPSYPGSFPFRAVDLPSARALLEGMRAHSLPGATWSGVVVEDDEALEAALLQAGATLRMRIEHYEGDVPRA